MHYTIKVMNETTVYRTYFSSNDLQNIHSKFGHYLMGMCWIMNGQLFSILNKILTLQGTTLKFAWKELQKTTN